MSNNGRWLSSENGRERCGDLVVHHSEILKDGWLVNNRGLIYLIWEVQDQDNYRSSASEARGLLYPGAGSSLRSYKGISLLLRPWASGPDHFLSGPPFNPSSLSLYWAQTVRAKALFKEIKTRVKMGLGAGDFKKLATSSWCSHSTTRISVWVMHEWTLPKTPLQHWHLGLRLS